MATGEIVMMTLVPLTAVLLALLAGVLLLDAVALVPFWQSLPGAGVSVWFSRHAWRVDWVVGIIVALAALAAAGGLARAWTSRQRRMRMGVALGAVLGVVAIGGFFHWPMSRLLATPDGVPLARVPAVLWQWSVWEWVRVLLALLGCAAALSATTEPQASRGGRRSAQRGRRTAPPRRRKLSPQSLLGDG